MEEQEAIQQLKRGNPQGLEMLVKKYQLQTVRAANLIVRDPSLAEEIVQSAFLNAFEHIHQFDTGRSFGPWFLRSVINASIKTARRGSRLVSLDSGIDPDFLSSLKDHGPGPEALVESAETSQALREALAELSPEQRAAIVMRYYLNMNEEEMADQLGRPAGTIKWRLHKARENLRKFLQIRFTGSNPSENEQLESKEG
jgi:RNA polymerase sigma-70 factor, ECF subfamily